MICDRKAGGIGPNRVRGERRSARQQTRSSAALHLSWATSAAHDAHPGFEGSERLPNQLIVGVAHRLARLQKRGVGAVLEVGGELSHQSLIGGAFPPSFRGPGAVLLSTFWHSMT
jgi:hypothetical protein